jgi:hypothetical protein
MLIDNADWDTANDLRVPPNIMLVYLPSYSPEPGANEKVWERLRDCDVSGRLIPGARAILDACCGARTCFIAQPGRIRRLTDFERARKINSSCAWS